MRTVKASRKVKIPKGVTVSAKARNVVVRGERGILRRNFRHLACDIRIQAGYVIVEVWWGNRQANAAVRTVATHIENMMTGVSKGWQYNCRLVYAHFPILTTINDDGTQLTVRNFIGEKYVREVSMREGVTVDRNPKNKEELILIGNDIEKVSQTAADIRTSVLIKNKDIRKFLDGIYVAEKGTIGNTKSVI
eukprot:TRINITY_DN47_c1_g2_i2.p1 TRINITY_DN47_c1_g2~~TRINITY_DN47_c1_g2_i2.p1  ORF type:complete len:192 (-),score=42.08 TRINITY_DN47_c1_g2_i2:29-604(-)